MTAAVAPTGAELDREIADAIEYAAGISRAVAAAEIIRRDRARTRTRAAAAETRRHRTRRDRDAADVERFGETRTDGAIRRGYRLVRLVQAGTIPLDEALSVAETFAAALPPETWDRMVDDLDAVAAGPASGGISWAAAVRRASRVGTDAETRRSVRRQQRRYRSGGVPVIRGTAASDPGADLTVAPPPARRRQRRADRAPLRRGGEHEAQPRRWVSRAATPAPVTPALAAPVPRTGGAVSDLRPVWAVDSAGVVADAAAVFETRYAPLIGASTVPSGKGWRTTANVRVLAAEVERGGFVVSGGGTVLGAGRIVADDAPLLGVTRDQGAAVRGVEAARPGGVPAAREIGPASPWRVVSIPADWSPCAACAADPAAVEAGGSVHCPSRRLGMRMRQARRDERARREARARAYRTNGWQH